MDEFFIQFGAIFVVYNKSMIKNFLSILLITIIFFQSCVPARKFEEISEKQEVCAVELKTLKTLKMIFHTNQYNSEQKSKKGEEKRNIYVQTFITLKSEFPYKSL